MEKINLFSMIIPAYKQEKTISSNLKNLTEVLSNLPVPYEIIVIVDGKLDKTLQNAKKIKNKNIKVFDYEKNHGKGYAIQYGVQKAKGDIIGFIDAGMDLDSNGILILFNYMVLHNADIVIGSKQHPDSEVHYPFYRKIMSWGYRSMTHTLFNLSVKDTQVGLKLFKKKVAKDVFPRILVKTFAFDVETLAVAQALGYDRIYEAPIKLDFHPGISSITSKSFWKVISGMLWDTSAVFYRLRILKYYTKKRNL
jgi:glycosyltransferase involved in cell wall biosynthesis